MLTAHTGYKIKFAPVEYVELKLLVFSPPSDVDQPEIVNPDFVSAVVESPRVNVLPKVKDAVISDPLPPVPALYVTV